ncbi:uncharacterized protein LOC120350653 [Nilaparvata lugens]|uniref:uncharacterized protein LOC120350648 n=1 Tax=Nilaparvata lugens TaxID=108931 RepID=UPI00193EAF1F|nr:uncharacterized protein LOC120350648 [Nilaparvata lugens]XP_039281058.1 uncharacterized protein LOC120350653 [Nilaparvata lugens]
MDVVLSLVDDVDRLLSAFCGVRCDFSLLILFFASRRLSISGTGVGVWLMVIRWFFIRATVQEIGVPVLGAASTGCSSDALSSIYWAVNRSSNRIQLSSTCVEDKSSSIWGWKSVDVVPDADGGEQSGEASSGSNRLGLTGSFSAMACEKTRRRKNVL